CFQAGRRICISCERDLLNRLCFAGSTFDEEFTGLPLQILFADFHQMRCDLFRFLADLSRGHCCCRARNRRAAAGVCAQAIRSSVGVAFFDCNSRNWNSKLLRYYLSERCLVALSLRFGTQPRRGFTSRMDSDLATIEHLEASYVECM